MDFCLTKTKRLLSLLLMTALVGCQVGGKHKDGNPDGPKSASESLQKYSGAFDSSKISDINLSGFGSDGTLWALSSCDCEPTKLQSYLEKIAEGRGVLPQILMPSIREELKNNATLANLQKLPLGGVLAGIFTTDARLAKSVASGLSDKLENSPGGSELGKRLTLRFDGFQALKSGENSFNFSDQIARWHNVFSANGMWANGSAVDGKDHGLQTLEVLRSLAEWSYLVGIDKNTSGGYYGGLTVSAKDGALTLNGPVDPRSKAQPAWFLSGIYSIDYEAESAKELATSVHEKWTRAKQNSVTLDEQARFWHTAAVAFKRLRPENRKDVGSLFIADKKGVLPTEAHELPLAFLTSLKTLLPGPFIDKDSRLVRAEASFSAGDSDKEADVLALARLTRALVAWISELKTVTKDTVSESTLVKVESAAADLLPPLQLAVQTILQNHSQPAGDQGGTFGIALIQNGENLDLASSAEVLLALIEAESLVVESQFLRTRIEAILDWYGGDLLANKTSMNLEELLWMRALSAAAGKYTDKNPAWVSGALSFADKKLKETP